MDASWGASMAIEHLVALGAINCQIYLHAYHCGLCIHDLSNWLRGGYQLLQPKVQNLLGHLVNVTSSIGSLPKVFIALEAHV